LAWAEVECCLLDRRSCVLVCGGSHRSIQRGSTIHHWRSQCEDLILWPTPYTYTHMQQLYWYYRLDHIWSVPSTWWVCWSLQLNCGHPMFCLVLLYVKPFFEIRPSSIHRTWFFQCNLNFKILLFKWEILNLSLISVSSFCSVLYSSRI
jgi:hypothetical protein